MIHAIKTPFLRLGIFACLALTHLEDGGFCAETVSVKLASGRWFTGEVDARTDTEQLWLRFGDSTTSLLRPIRWSRVEFGSITETALDLPEFKEHAMNLATSHNVFEPQVSEAKTSAVRPADISRDDRPDAKKDTLQNLTKRKLLASVDFEAYIANWDNDVENDGLILHLQLLNDQGGIPRMAHGTLHIELITTLHAEPHNSFRRQGRQIVTLGTWVKHLVQDHVDTKGILIKLPFQANHPEFSSRMGTHGLVHVKFVVPGQGVFEASQDSIRIRPFSPLRDLREQQEDQRFFANEGTGRAKR